MENRTWIDFFITIQTMRIGVYLSCYVTETLHAAREAKFQIMENIYSQERNYLIFGFLAEKSNSFQCGMRIAKLANPTNPHLLQLSTQIIESGLARTPAYEISVTVENDLY